MTIGPEPMTRTDWISVRLGTLALRELHEAVEQVGGVVRAGRRFGVVLDAEGRLAEELETLHHVVVEADVGDLGAAVGGVGDLVERGVDGEAVVVRGDLDLAGRTVLHRLVDAAWPYFSLKVPKPSARPRIWLPKQMPNSGVSRSRTPRITETGWSAVDGSPGPLEKKTPSGLTA